ncbi:hypothetical protein DIPPA_23158 [Diplonema papillatum]|nr:hypothetical protein DIPPA_23158 [Diplonema papillatum]
MSAGECTRRLFTNASTHPTCSFDSPARCAGEPGSTESIARLLSSTTNPRSSPGAASTKKSASPTPGATNASLWSNPPPPASLYLASSAATSSPKIASFRRNAGSTTFFGFPSPPRRPRGTVATRHVQWTNCASPA